MVSVFMLVILRQDRYADGAYICFFYTPLTDRVAILQCLGGTVEVYAACDTYQFSDERIIPAGGLTVIGVILGKSDYVMSDEYSAAG